MSRENQRYEQLREKVEEEELKIDLLLKENSDLEEQHDFLANRVISSQLVYNDVDRKIEKAKKEKERLEECVRMQNIRLLDLIEILLNHIKYVEIPERLYYNYYGLKYCRSGERIRWKMYILMAG